MRRPRLDRRSVLLVGGLVALLAIALPAIAADPPPEPPGQQEADKPDKGAEIEATLNGTVVRTTDEKGRPTFTLAAGGKTWELSAGPKWFLGDDSPMAAFVGETVEVTGTYHEGETDLSVETVNGEPIRAAGKPAWAGGPWVVGEAHPGWKAWKADGKPGNALGRASAPGQLKDRTGDESGG